MTEKGSFGITSEQITDISVHIRRISPDYIWGDGEFRNAVFETLVAQHHLPWDENTGSPNFGDSRVISLSKEFNKVLNRDNETITLGEIEGRCETTDCNFKTIGQAKLDKTDRILDECDLTQKCRKHHEETGQMIKHNRFILFKNDKQVGLASVSTQVCTGYIEPLE